MFHEYDRGYEHQQFLDWLVEILKSENIDVLLISGDVFDLSNPSSVSIKMFYSFLNIATKSNTDLQIIVTAGNHDSPSRLESPKPLLESSNIHIIGLVEKDERGEIDYEKLFIPLTDNAGEIKAWCLAAPFLRMGDYPVIADCDNPYAEGVAAFYKNAYDYIGLKKQPGAVVIAMGHLHAQHAEVGDIDKMERKIMGGIECISALSFDDNISYVALGHIHKAQRLGGKEHIRYCGSPLPMSFSEINYKHQVIVFNIKEEKVQDLQAIEIPVSVPLRRIPAVHSSLAEALNALALLPPMEGDIAKAPYLQVLILADGPDPGLKHKIETALTGKYIRLATIDKRSPATSSSTTESETTSAHQLIDLNPLDVLHKVYRLKYNNPIPEDLVKLFQQATHEISQTES